MIKNSVFFFIVVVFISSCSTEPEEEKDPYPVKEGQQLKYNNEYLKIIDKNEGADKPQRLINEDAILNLGLLEIEWGDYTKKIKTFRKGGTDMHFSERGIRIRVRDMHDFQLNIQLFHAKSPFHVEGVRFTSGEGKNKKAHLEIFDRWENDSIHLVWEEGKLEVEKLIPSSGKVELSLSGSATDIISQQKQPVEVRLELRFEQVTSSFRPS